MMYLVLTAMLALNVAAETLKAFKIIDGSLMKTYFNFREKNLLLIDDFEKAYIIDSIKVREWKGLAEKVHHETNLLIDYIVETKELLVLGAGGHLKENDESVSEEACLILDRKGNTMVLLRQDDLNISPQLMLTRYRGKALQDSIMKYRQLLIDISRGNTAIIENLKTALDVDDPKREKILDRDASLNFRTWAQENFEASPVIASISLLSKLQIDICNAESVVLRHLYNTIYAEQIKITGLKATMIPNSSFVFQGEEYKARIFLSAEDSTLNYNVYVNGSDRPLPKSGNEAIFTIRPNSPGQFTYKGEIRYPKPLGKGDTSLFFSYDYEVAVPAVTISPTKMNVLYKNLQNPISISVPNMPSTRLRPSMTNGTISRLGNEWLAEPNELDGDGSRTRIIVNVEVNGQLRSMGEMPFRVKKVPDPRATVAQLSSGNISPQRLQAQVGVFAQMEDFDFDLKFEVTSFAMSVPTGGGYTTTLHSNSYRFTEQQQTLLSNLGPGDKLYIENVKARIQGNPNDPERILAPVILTVN